MRYYMGIDLGSTTTKALIVDDDSGILGKGITNTRSNYNVATRVAYDEALYSARFRILEGMMEVDGEADREVFDRLARSFRFVQEYHKFEHLKEALLLAAGEWGGGSGKKELIEAMEETISSLSREAETLFTPTGGERSQFFRDIVGSRYTHHSAEVARKTGASFDTLMSLFDKAILRVENRALDLGFKENILRALERLKERGNGDGIKGDEAFYKRLEEMVEQAIEYPLTIMNSVGTGYGRQRLPFHKDQIRSEILCHGLGAHFMFPGTRTVLDIGGQDTKAIQVDGDGLVTSFQMNDRCAAGCGRYLGYIADELNMGVHEIGPLALKADYSVRICSTCTVFSGAELRDQLSMGEKRENILAGLHRAIILRALSLLARSGGIREEFTFTGGVAKNPAVVSVLRELVEQSYGEITLNRHPDSIYTGALGAALFAGQYKGEEPRELIMEED
jgi:benzoyl-CoA reductase subunit A